MRAAAHKRQPFSTARLTMVSMVLAGAGGKTQKVMELLLSDGYVESVDLKASESNKAISIKETVTLSYTKCELMYYPPDPSDIRRTAPMTFQLQLKDPDSMASSGA
jgi:type VI protein secretion system component Hcp